jgi:cobalt-zinc-cadmium efflux system protein
MIIALLGLFANILSIAILAKDNKENVNLRGAFLHMIADALGSVGAIIAGLIIITTGWQPADTLASIAIGLLILWSSIGFLKQTTNILLEATPDNIDYLEVKKSLEEIENIEAVHDLHIWTITSGMPILSAHIRLASCCTDTNLWERCIHDANRLLKEKFGIEHTTLQVEPYEGECTQECLINE